MKYDQFDVVLQEVPGEISLSFSITGCPIRCKGCHSPHLWKASRGTELTADTFTSLLNRYRAYATCVLFMGGEWEEEPLLGFLRTAREYGYRTCLYTGSEEVTPALISELDYLKTGPWIEELGGLDSPSTNQRMIRLTDNTEINYLFQ